MMSEALKMATGKKVIVALPVVPVKLLFMDTLVADTIPVIHVPSTSPAIEEVICCPTVKAAVEVKPVIVLVETVRVPVWIVGVPKFAPSKVPFLK